MNIIIDTNVLRGDFLFQSEQCKLFSEFIRKSKSILVLSKVVFEEACYLFEKEVRIKKSNFQKALSEMLRFGCLSLIF